MVFIATTHEYEVGLDNKLIRERRITCVPHVCVYCPSYLFC